MSTDSGFSDLVQQAERLTADMDTTGELPRVERNLKQTLEAGQHLWARTAQSGAQDVKASILLGSKGVDLPSISQRLETLSATKTFQPLEPIRDTDIEGFLENERENTILAVIEESRKSTFEAVDRLHWEVFQSRWEDEKQRILSTLASSAPDLLDVTIQPELSADSSRLTAGTRSCLTSQEMAYVQKLADYIDRVSTGSEKPDLVTMLRQVPVEQGDDTGVELWDLVRCVTEVQVRSQVGRFSQPVQMAILRQARRHLESTYVQQLHRLVFSNLPTARLGGVPGTRHLVQSYLSVRPPAGAALLDDVRTDGTPAWPLIYHCLRCGDTAAAREAAQQASPPLTDIARVLNELARSRDGRLTVESESVVRLQYRRMQATSSDPYKRAVYTVLGATDLSEDHPDVATSTDDFLWLKLSGLLAQSQDVQMAALARLQLRLLEELGEAHFDAYNQPVLYFGVLMLSGQMEAAVEFLARLEALRSHAVHIALALHQINLIQLPNSPQAPMLSRDPGDDSPRRRLNITRLVLMYTRRFEAADPTTALHYLYMLRQLGADGAVQLFSDAVAELVLESAQYAQLLGKILPDGTRQKGALDRYGFNPRPVIQTVAERCEQRGLLEDAVQMYDLANNHQKVLELLNQLLSQVVPHRAVPGSRRDRLQTMVVEIARRFKELGHTGSAEAAGTLYLLLDLMSFFDLYHLERSQEALSVLDRLRLVALSADQLEVRLSEFNKLQEEVRRCIPDVLLAAMNLLFSVHRQQGQQAREQARALITYAGSIPFRLPGDTHARLVQMEALIN